MPKPLPGAGYAMPRMLYYNLGNGAFRNVTLTLPPGCSRGLATGDLDNDGSPEIVIVNHNGPPTVFKNFGDRGNWISVNIKTVGAVVKVRAGGVTRTSVVSSGSSYLSQSDFRQHFGVGAAQVVESVEVLWSDGRRSAVKEQPVNREISISAP